MKGPSAVKLIEENIWKKNLFKIGLSIDFSELTPKAQTSKVCCWEIDKIINLCTAKEKAERQVIK